MIGLLIKLIVCPLTVYLANVLFQTVSYANVTQIVIVGVVLAILAHLMEVLVFRESTFWLSTVMDFIAATLIIYISQFFLRNAVVTFTGAILAAILLTVTEYFQHQYLVRTNKVKS